MIFQELNDAPDLSVAENIYLGEWPRNFGLIDGKQIRVGERQLLEIVLALLQDAKILVV
jgi:ABC-type sugar transport system ATPase subunit